MTDPAQQPQPDPEAIADPQPEVVPVPVDELEARRSALVVEIDGLQRTRDELATENARLAGQQGDFLNVLNDKEGIEKRRLGELQSLADSVRGELTLAREERDAALLAAEESARRNEDLRAEVAQRQSLIAGLQEQERNLGHVAEEIERKRNLEAQYDAQIAEQTTALSSARALREDAERGLERVRAELETARQEREAINGEVDADRGTLRELRQGLLDTAGQNELRAGDLDHREAELAQRAAALDDRERTIEPAEDNLRAMHARLDERDHELAERYRAFTGEQENHIGQQRELQALKESLESARAEIAETRAELEKREADVAGKEADQREQGIKLKRKEDELDEALIRARAAARREQTAVQS